MTSCGPCVGLDRQGLCWSIGPQTVPQQDGEVECRTRERGTFLRMPCPGSTARFASDTKLLAP